MEVTHNGLENRTMGKPLFKKHYLCLGCKQSRRQACIVRKHFLLSVFFTFCQFVAVCYPFNTTFRSKRFFVWFISCSYLIGTAVYFPWAWKKVVLFVGHRSNFSHCPYVACDDYRTKQSPWFEPYQWTREAVSRLVPVLVIAFFNIRILCEYKRSAGRRSLVAAAGTTFATAGGHQSIAYPKKCEKEQSRLLKTLLTLTGLFFLCTLPAAALTIFVSDIREKDFLFQLVRSVTNILEITRFALNFYFYCLINPNIRALFFKRITCQEIKINVPRCREARRLYALKSLSELRKDGDHNSKKSLLVVYGQSGGTSLIRARSPGSKNTIKISTAESSAVEDRQNLYMNMNRVNSYKESSLNGDRVA
uniref:G-protein coupled receptors family 1 profile domain-containing protein n=1 Tax=Romanomermis culicivorax TaxID=13658 RepID=A0A915K928_ROMCU